MERKAAAADLAAARARGVLVPLLPASAADHERASAMMSARAAGMTQSSLRTLADAPAHVVTGVAASLPAHAAPAVRGAPVTRTGGALVPVGAKRSRAALDAASNGQHARTAASIAAAHVATRTLVAAAPWKRMDTDRVRVPEQLLQELAQAAARKLDACSSAAATMPKIVRRMADDGLAAAGSPPATR
ncbi:hypothetical protein EON68_01340 [archaeon]|nr:MAG: hypothetical protein EON68_01340 [archaeon]